jgi:hypothetical protein
MLMLFAYHIGGGIEHDDVREEDRWSLPLSITLARRAQPDRRAALADRGRQPVAARGTIGGQGSFGQLDYQVPGQTLGYGADSSSTGEEGHCIRTTGGGGFYIY